MSAYAAAHTRARACMICGSPDSMPVMLNTVAAHGMQGPLENQKAKAFDLPLRRGGSDAKDVVRASPGKTPF